ncbi:hypothetical protein QQF64_031329, partial [Cirrhinus molitorella]
MCQPSPFS